MKPKNSRTGDSHCPASGHVPTVPLACAPLSILVAEEDPCDALLLEQAFHKAEVHVPLHFVADGQEVLEYLQGQPPFANRAVYPLPTLLLLKLEPLQLTDFDLLKWLRQEPALDGLQVVVFSSSATAGEFEQAYGYGADFHLSKPEDIGEMIDAVEQLKSYWLAQ